MKSSHRRLLLLACMLITVNACAMSSPVPSAPHTANTNQIVSPIPGGGPMIPRYEKTEFTFPYAGNYANPNDPSQVDVEATIHGPTGTTTLPGFLYQGYTRSGNAYAEALTPSGKPPVWMIRFAPSVVGNYSYTVTLRDSQHTTTLGSGLFTAVQSANPGFIRANGYRLVRDNGEPVIPVGINAPWWQSLSSRVPNAWGDGTYGMDNMLSMFRATGVNFAHFWTCAPWTQLNVGCDSGNGTTSPVMDQAASWRIDYLVQQAHVQGVLLMPVLKHVDQMHFTDGDAVKARYFVARWGYETNILAWDWNKEGATNPDADAAWTQYEYSIDPYSHLRTASEWNHYPVLGNAQRSTYSQIFSDKYMTLVQNHDYVGDCADTNLGAGDPYDSTDPGFGLFYMRWNPRNGPLRGHDPRAFDAFHKPSFFGETGVKNTTRVDPCTDQGANQATSVYAQDTQGLIIESQAWGALMGTLGAYAPWYFRFDQRFDASGNWAGSWTNLAGFKGVAAYAAALPVVPDNAMLFSSFRDASQVATTSASLRVIGRKNAEFAMLHVQNTTGTALTLLHGGVAQPVGGTVTLKRMLRNTAFSVRWFDTSTAAQLAAASVSSDSSGALALNLPSAISQSVAAIVTSASA
jgi:hypothetical protein